MSDNPLVSICCITYNHAPYIRQCLDGFLMQKTNFKYEIIIHDDCSTDGTTEIIREYASKYPEIFVPLYEDENQYSKGVRGITAKFVYPKARGKYIALCEGDDYWIDENKLQKQVDFLENNLDYGMCYTRAVTFKQQTNKFETKFGGVAETFDSLIDNNVVPTMTVLVRTGLVFEYIKEVEPNKRNWKLGDYPIWLYISLNHKIKYLPFVTAVYRILTESASHFINVEDYIKFIDSDNEIRNYFLSRKGLPPRSIDRARIGFKFFMQKYDRKESKKWLCLIQNKTKKEKIYYFICCWAILFKIYKYICLTKLHLRRVITV